MDNFGQFWKFLDYIGPFWTCLVIPGRPRRSASADPTRDQAQRGASRYPPTPTCARGAEDQHRKKPAVGAKDEARWEAMSGNPLSRPRGDPPRRPLGTRSRRRPEAVEGGGAPRRSPLEPPAED